MAPSTPSSRSSSGKSDLGWDRLWGRPVGFVPSNSPKRELRNGLLERDAAFEAMLTDHEIFSPLKSNSSKSRKSSNNSGNSLSPIIPDSGPLAGAPSDSPIGQMSEKRKGKQKVSSYKGYLHDVKNRVKALKVTKVPKEAPRSRTRKPEAPDPGEEARRRRYVDVKPDGTFTVSPAGQYTIRKRLNKELPLATLNHLEVINEALHRTRIDLEKNQPWASATTNDQGLVEITNSRDISKIIYQVIEENQNPDLAQAVAREGISALNGANGVEASDLYPKFIAHHFMWLGVKIGMKISEKQDDQK